MMQPPTKGMPMKKPHRLTLISAGAVLSLGLAACGSSAKTTSTPSQGAGYGAATTTVVNSSAHKGGTLIYVNSQDWDSPDPGNTYYGWSWDFARLYSRTLVTYSAVPGTAGEKLVPDLATSLGQVSNSGLTWTYHLRQGVKLEDGETVTSQMIKYAIERSSAYTPGAGKPAVLPLGPTYWSVFLKDPTYPSAYYDKTPGKMGLTGISTPDPSTIVFNLTKPMAEFDYLATLAQTAPVPEAKDTGTSYLKHPLSSGPYMFQGNYTPGKGMTLVKNPNWDPSTDPVRKQLVDKIVVTVSVPATDEDNRLLSGQADLDISGRGVSPSDSARVLLNSKNKASADDVLDGFYIYTALNTKVAPFNNIHCREAVLYAADHAELQTAYGGSYGGDISTQALPPQVGGYIPGYDPYGFAAHPHGDLTAAKQQLALCGQPNGFSTTIATRNASDDPKENAGAVALQAELAKVGIHADLYQYPAAQIGSVVGTPDFVHSHHLGLMMYGWGPDWPAGFGFLNAIVNGAAITPAGNSNLEELNDPAINSELNNVMAINSISGRSQVYSQIDRQVMQDAVFLPIVNLKSLLYRNPRLSNVFYNAALLMYDYSQIGLK